MIKQELFAKALDTAVPETWNTLTYLQLHRFANELVKLTVERCIKIALDLDTPQTALGIADVFEAK